MRHTAVVPKVFVRYQLLELLSEKPLSCSEVMNEIERRTDGHWRPSPGSIYPLLGWLLDSGYTKELPTEEGMKRYTLTEKGKKLHEEQRRMKMKFREEAKFFGPPFLGALWFRIPAEKTMKLRESMRRLFSVFFELGSALEESFSEKTVEEVSSILDETAEKLEEATKKLGR